MWLQAIKADIRDWEPEIQFDAIICNPPFFENQLPSENEDKRRARHTVTLNFEILFEKINSFLNEEGLCWLLTPVLHLNSIKSITEKYNFHIQQFVNIASFKHSKSHLISLHIGKNKTENKFNDFFIYEEQGAYSPGMKLLMNDFYLTQPI